MNKNVIKEIIIILLMCLAVILILGVVLYEYVPNTKTLPEKVSYTTPSNITQELIKNGGIDESKVIMTYQLDSADISNYQKINNYNPGKSNPFATAESGTTGQNTTNNGSGNSGNTSNNGNTTNGGTTNNNSEGNTSPNNTPSNGGYTQEKGTK